MKKSSGLVGLIALGGLGALGLMAMSSKANASGGSTVATASPTKETLQYCLYTLFAIMREDKTLKQATIDAAAKYMQSFGKPKTALAIVGKMTSHPLPDDETWPNSTKSSQKFVIDEYNRYLSNKAAYKSPYA